MGAHQVVQFPAGQFRDPLIGKLMALRRWGHRSHIDNDRTEASIPDQGRHKGNLGPFGVTGGNDGDAFFRHWGSIPIGGFARQPADDSIPSPG